MTPDFSVFGQLVKQRREALDLTQAELAERLGYALDTITKIETGRRRPSKQLIALLITTLEIPPPDQAAFLRLGRSGLMDPAQSLATGSPASASAATLGSLLPLFLTPFHGREAELAQIDHLIRQVHKRLVTLTGLGGIGKTRLAVQAAAQLQDYFPHGVAFVDLSPIQDPTFIEPLILRALGHADTLPLGFEGLATYLADKQLLLILDNCEHQPGVGAVVKNLLARAPRLNLLVTSRSILRIAGEQVLGVAPLPLPPPGSERVEDLADYAVVQLFVERARAVLGEFNLQAANARPVLDLCRKLEGVPLAIELAVAWLRVLPLEALIPRLAQRLDLLGTTLEDWPPHQAGLRAVFDWSYELLPPVGQRVFAGLGIFAGSWTLEAAETLLGGPLLILRLLTESNLIGLSSGPTPEPRYVMLGIVREYALEQLAATGTADALQRAHALYYLQWVDTNRAQFTGPQANQWLGRLEAEHDNIRAALNWLLAHAEYEAAAQLSSALVKFWTDQGYVAEGYQWIRATLASGPLPPSVWGRTLRVAGFLAQNQGDFVTAQGHYEQSLAILRGRELANALRGLGAVVQALGKYEQAAAYYEESLQIFQELGDQRGIALVRMDQIALGPLQGQVLQMQQYYEEALAIFRAQGDENAIALTLMHMGEVYVLQRSYAEAAALLEESRDLFHHLKSPRKLAGTMVLLGAAMTGQAKYGQAFRYYRAALEMARETNTSDILFDCLDGLGECIARLGELRRAVMLISFTTALRKEQHTYLEAHQHAGQVALLDAMRPRLGPASFEAAWEAGRQASLNVILAEVTETEQHIAETQT